MIRSCSGSCQEGAAPSLLWEQKKRQRKRRMRKRARRRVRRHRSQWNPYSSSPSPGLNRVSQNPQETSGGGCCQPIRFKQKNIQFHCPKNGATGGVERVYSRWFRFVRKCGCTSSCNSGTITSDGTPSAGFWSSFLNPQPFSPNQPNNRSLIETSLLISIYEVKRWPLTSQKICMSLCCCVFMIIYSPSP